MTDQAAAESPAIRTRPFTRTRRILARVPLRLSLLAIRPIAFVSHRKYMRLLLPLLRGAGLKLTGTPRYIAPTVFMDDFDKITLGERVVISSHVSLLTHDYSLTTVLIATGQHDGGGDVAIVRPITVGSNVFIGRGSLIMPGTTIEDNVIVGAASVVRGVVPKGTIVIGNPAEPAGGIQELHDKYAARSDRLDVRKDV